SPSSKSLKPSSSWVLVPPASATPTPSGRARHKPARTNQWVAVLVIGGSDGPSGEDVEFEAGVALDDRVGSHHPARGLLEVDGLAVAAPGAEGLQHALGHVLEQPVAGSEAFAGLVDRADHAARRVAVGE